MRTSGVPDDEDDPLAAWEKRPRTASAVVDARGESARHGQPGGGAGGAGGEDLWGDSPRRKAEDADPWKRSLEDRGSRAGGRDSWRTGERDGWDSQRPAPRPPAPTPTPHPEPQAAEVERQGAPPRIDDQGGLWSREEEEVRHISQASKRLDAWDAVELEARAAARAQPELQDIVTAEHAKRARIVVPRPPDLLPPLQRPLRFTTHWKIPGSSIAIVNHFKTLSWQQVRYNRPEYGDCSEVTFRHVFYKINRQRIELGRECMDNHDPFLHMTSHFENVVYLDDKVLVHKNLVRYYETREAEAMVPGLRLSDFYPKAYALDKLEECRAFFEEEADRLGTMWVKKDSNMLSGKGVEFLRAGQFGALERMVGGRTCSRVQAQSAFATSNATIIMQQFLHPYLMNGRKFDLRAYAYVASLDPLLVLFHEGPIRRCLFEYSLQSLNDPNRRGAHVCNIGTARLHPEWGKRYGENHVVLELPLLQRELDKRYPGLRVFDRLIRRMRRIMEVVLRAGRDKLAGKPGQFELIAFDFFLDRDLNLWFLESQPTPGATYHRMPGVWASVIDTQWDMLLSRREGRMQWPFRPSVRHAFDPLPVINEFNPAQSSEHMTPERWLSHVDEQGTASLRLDVAPPANLKTVA